MLWIEMKADTVGQPCASASKISAASNRLSPEPPTSSRMYTPPMPSLAASRITSTGKCFSSSQRIACGAIFSAAKSRAMSRTGIWSSLRANCIGYPRLRLVHRRNRKLRAFLDAGGPARRHGLGLGVEADRIRAVLVEIAEAGLLPAAEGVIGDRHRDRHVDADHADIDFGGEIARGIAVAGEDRNAVAVVMVGRQRQRLLVVMRAHHREHRAKNLLLVDPHVLGHVVEQAAAHIEPVLIALHFEVTAVDREGSAFLDADLDGILDAVERLTRHQRTVIGRREIG